MNTAIFWLTGPTNQSRPIANLFNFYVFCPIWMKFGMWTTIWQKTTYNEFEIATAIFWLTTTTQIAAQVTGISGIRGIRGRGSKGPHHHQQDFTFFSLWREPPLLITMKVTRERPAIPPGESKAITLAMNFLRISLVFSTFPTSWISQYRRKAIVQLIRKYAND